MPARSFLEAVNPVAYFRKYVGPPRVVARRMRHRANAAIAFARSYSSLGMTKRANRKSSKPRLLGIGLIEHMGDIVAAEPILRQVRHDHPDAFIVWCVRAPFRELVDTHPAVDRTLVVSCLTEWIHLRGSGVFDRIVDLHMQARICPTCEIPLKRPEGNQAITQSNYLEFGGLLDIMRQYADVTIAEEDPRLHIPDAAARSVDTLKLPTQYIVIHCASNERARDWPVELWRELVADPAHRQLQFVEIGLVPVVSHSPLPNYRSLCGTLTLLEMAEVIRRAVLFIGVESGPAHIANAVGTYGIVLMGPYRAFTHYNPYSGAYRTGQNAKLLLEPQGLPMLKVATVSKVVTDFMQRSSV